jgi:hypothetical protein
MVTPVTVNLLDPGVAEYVDPKGKTSFIMGFDSTQPVDAEDGQ